ncbi:MAG: hypothetical protein ACLFRO_05655 [Desulfobacterales bacterium]
MNDTRLPYTHTLARLYETQGHKHKADEIYNKLHTGVDKNASDEKQFRSSSRESQNGRSGGPSELALLMGRWLDLLRRLRYLETKS